MQTILASWDSNPVEWFFCGIALLSVVGVVILVILIREPIPPCWVPRATAAAAMTTVTSASDSLGSDSSVPCIPRVFHALRIERAGRRLRSDLLFSEWLSLRSVLLWMDPDELVIYSSVPLRGKWLNRLVAISENRTKVVVAPRRNPTAVMATRLRERGGVTWNTAMYAVMPFDQLLCTAFDSLVSFDQTQLMESGVGHAVVLSLPQSPFAASLESALRGTNGTVGFADVARRLAHVHPDDTLQLPEAAFFPESSMPVGKMFGSTTFHRWGTAFSVSLASYPDYAEELDDLCDVVAGSNVNIRSVLRPVMWSSFFKGELPEMRRCRMTIDWVASAVDRPTQSPTSKQEPVKETQHQQQHQQQEQSQLSQW